MSLIKRLLNQFTNGIAGIGLAAVSAALLAYFRSEAFGAIHWLFQPLVRFLPWNRRRKFFDILREQQLLSEATIADVYLTSTDGTAALYRKTADYVVRADSLTSYREGVTTSGVACGFSTEVGAIVRTTAEHGFYVSEIELDLAARKGSRFRNVFSACLRDSFTAQEEHWTQEIGIPTKRLSLRVHFPKERPPIIIRAKLVRGLFETKDTYIPARIELSGLPAVVWDIQNPSLGDIYKLKWRW